MDVIGNGNRPTSVAPKDFSLQAACTLREKQMHDFTIIVECKRSKFQKGLDITRRLVNNIIAIAIQNNMDFSALSDPSGLAYHIRALTDNDAAATAFRRSISGEIWEEFTTVHYEQC